jgi:hypothetical protein
MQGIRCCQGGGFTSVGEEGGGVLDRLAEGSGAGHRCSGLWSLPSMACLCACTLHPEAASATAAVWSALVRQIHQHHCSCAR